MKQAIIIDIDSTLLDSSIPLALRDKARAEGDDNYWDVFYNNLHLCDRNTWCYNLIDQMTLNNDLTVLFITGRQERARKSTQSFLKFKRKISFELLMRSNNDLREDEEVKFDILSDVMCRYEILFAIDDKESNCEMFKSNGIPTLKVF